MASDSRALTLKLLADTADFQKKLAAGSKDIDSIGERAAEFGKKAAIAFAAAGAAVGAFALSAVKAAAEDEAAQLKLAATIEATTGATAQQIAEVEKYITKTSIAVGVTDDELRPAFSRLVKSTSDTTEAQKLLNLALDLSAATGKPLEQVSNALGRAYDGNTLALGKLGLGIDATSLKSQDFNTTFAQLDATFGNFAEETSESTAMQMEKVTIALDEAKESIGAALLPVVQELSTFILNTLVPNLNAFIAGLTGQEGLDDSLTASQKTAVDWGKKLKGFIELIIDLGDELLILGGILAGIFVATKIAAGVTAIITLINGLIVAFNALRASAIVAGVAKAFALNPIAGVAAVAVGAAVIAGAVAISRNDETKEVKGPKVSGSSEAPFTRAAATASIGGRTTARGKSSGTGAPSVSTPTLIDEVSEANFIKRTAGTGSFDIAGFRRGEESDRVTININGAIDPASTARQVYELLNSQASIGGSFENLGLNRFAQR